MTNPIQLLKHVITSYANPIPVYLGSWEEIAYNMQMKGVSNSQIYPAIVIPLGYKYSFGESLIHECVIKDLPVYFLTSTKSDENIDNRYNATYNGILYPLVDKFESIILKSNKFDLHVKGMNQEIKRVVTEFPFDSKMKTDQNKLKDIVDCLEVKYESIALKKIKFNL